MNSPAHAASSAVACAAPAALSSLLSSRLFQLILLTVAVWSMTYARFAIGPLQESMRVDLALSDNHMALLQGTAFAIPLAVSAIPLGLLFDRYSRARLCFFFVALGVAASALTALAPGTGLLFVARALLGPAVAAVLIAVYSLVADLYPPEQRGRATMVVTLGEIGGAPAAFALGGVLLVMTGAGPSAWRDALLWMSALLLLPLLMLLALREPPRTGIVVKDPPLREVGRELWRYRAVLIPLFLARTMVWIADGAVLVWAAPTLTRRFALPPDEVAAIVATALLVAGLLGPIIGGPLADFCQKRGGPRRTIATLAGAALLSTPAAFFGLMPDATSAAVLLTLLLVLGFTIGTAAITVGTIVIPGELRGLYIAVTATVGALFSFAVAPPLVSLLSGALGGEAKIGEALAIVCGITSFLGAIVFARGRRHFPTASGGVYVPG